MISLPLFRVYVRRWQRVDVSVDDDVVVGAFSEEHASRLSGVSLHQLRHWDIVGFLRPSLAAENRREAYSRVYSFRDIVSLRVLNDLRNDKGISLQHLKKVAAKLSDLGDEKWTKTILYVLGKRVVFENPRTSLREEVVSGQRVLDVPLRVAISDTRRAIRDLNHRDPSDFGTVVRGRFLQQNEPVFSGTRVPVAAIQRFLAAGYSTDDIISEYPELSPQDIEAARKHVDRITAA